MESGFGNMVIDSLFPRYCMGCHKEGTLWCFSCASTWWPPFVHSCCPFCGDKAFSITCDKCQSNTFLDGLNSFFYYKNPVVREAVLQWKYIGDSGVAPILYKWVARGAPVFAGNFSDVAFVPVPLHTRKRRSRGFDQAGMFADWCGQIYSNPVYDLLVRKKATASQALQKHDERQLGQFDNVFIINPLADFMPKTVVLCDDVFTSGTTMDSAAKCLKEAGVKCVLGLVIAKGK